MGVDTPLLPHTLSKREHGNITILLVDIAGAVAARSKAQICGRSPAETVGSNPTGGWVFVCCECCVLSGTSLCDELITGPKESYRLWCVVVCDLETS